MLLPKPQRFQSLKYRTFISKLPCICYHHGGCSGDVVAHHVFAGGHSTKCDDTYTLSLCHKHHSEIEAINKGKKWFAEEYLIDWWKEIAKCQSAWIRENCK